jgi:hypothetical protein
VGNTMCGTDCAAAAKVAGAAPARTPPAVRVESLSRKERRVIEFMGLGFEFVRANCTTIARAMRRESG